MFNALLTDARNTAERTARRAVRSAMLGACAAVCGAVALGFLTAAAFLALMHDHGAIAAALTLGIGYLVLAALCLVALSAGRAPVAPPPPAVKPRPPLGEAFLLGMEAGRGFGKGFRSRR
ncbi:MAG: phage holin family protein [Defluviimonas sp.]|nr:phage holin family protein [Defluviimonas sp.]